MIAYYSLDLLSRVEIVLDKYLMVCLLQSSITLGFIITTPFMACIGRKPQYITSGLLTSCSMVVIGIAFSEHVRQYQNLYVKE